MKPIARVARLSTSSIVSNARRVFSSSGASQLKLAYDLHEPPNQKIREERGQPIIFIHGLFGSKKNNRTMSRIFARDLKRPVYAIDLRNHGESPHDPKHDYESMAGDVEQFIGEHKLHKPTIIGHSMGAKVAMTLALKHPSIVGSMISVDNAPIDAALKSDFGSYVEGMKQIDAAKLDKSKDAYTIMEKFEKSLPIQQFLLANLMRTGPKDQNYLQFRIPLDILSKSLDNMADFPYKSHETHRYEGPALFVRGTKSRYVADETLPAIGNFFPCFELRDIEAGHWVISENPEAFKQVVEEWLGDKES